MDSHGSVVLVQKNPIEAEFKNDQNIGGNNLLSDLIVAMDSTQAQTQAQYQTAYLEAIRRC